MIYRSQYPLARRHGRDLSAWLTARGLLTLREAFCPDNAAYFRGQPPDCQPCGTSGASGQVASRRIYPRGPLFPGIHPAACL